MSSRCSKSRSSLRSIVLLCVPHKGQEPRQLTSDEAGHAVILVTRCRSRKTKNSSPIWPFFRVASCDEAPRAYDLRLVVGVLYSALWPRCNGGAPCFSNWHQNGRWISIVGPIGCLFGWLPREMATPAKSSSPK